MQAIHSADVSDYQRIGGDTVIHTLANIPYDSKILFNAVSLNPASASATSNSQHFWRGMNGRCAAGRRSFHLQKFCLMSLLSRT